MVCSDFHSLFRNCLFDCLSLRTDYRNKMETTSCCFVHLCLCARFGFTTTILAGGIYSIHRTTGPMACLNCFRSNISVISCICYQRKIVIVALNINLVNPPSACICIFHWIWIQRRCGSNVGLISLRLDTRSSYNAPWLEIVWNGGFGNCMDNNGFRIDEWSQFNSSIGNADSDYSSAQRDYLPNPVTRTRYHGIIMTF